MTPNPPPSERPSEPHLGQRLLFVSVLFGVLLTFPFLGVFDHQERVGGIPGLYLYVLVVWALLVLLTGWLVRGIKN